MGLIMRKRHSITKNDDSVKQKLLDSLAEESPMVISTAYAYAKNYLLYGVDITKAWTTAVQQASIIEQVKVKAQVEAYNSFKKEYETDEVYDKDTVAWMFRELQLEIEELDSRAGYSGNGMPTFSTDYIRKKKVNELIQQKIDTLKESRPEVLYNKALAGMRNYAKKE